MESPKVIKNETEIIIEHRPPEEFKAERCTYLVL